MLSALSELREINLLTVLLRMALAILCGLLIGMERSSKNHSAGFRTHMLVCIGTCTASLTGHYLYLNQNLPTDISRLGAQVISGLGFIGAGTIIVTKEHSVKGLTTAAGLWACGIVGLACGAGFYEGAILTSAAILIIEIFFGNIGNLIRHPEEFQIIINYDNRESINLVQRYCKDRHLAITSLQIGSNDAGTGSVDGSGIRDTSDTQDAPGATTGTQDAPGTAPASGNQAGTGSPGYSAFLSLRNDGGIDPEELLQHIRGIKGIHSADRIKIK